LDQPVFAQEFQERRIANNPFVALRSAFLRLTMQRFH
jgi:hypothetical protein